MNLQENIQRIREVMELNPNERVYDYQKGRDTVSEKLPFDINKLVDSGVVFVTPAIDGDPNSETYKEWLEEPYTHLISLHNVEHSSEDGWIQKAITKRASTERWKDNFVDKLYDGKYNQILWSLEKLGIDPMSVLIDDESEEVKEGLHDTSWQNEKGDKITLIDLLNATEEIPVQKISVEELKPYLLSWDDNPEEIKKIEKADLQYPILIFVTSNGEFISIIDGHHRAQKAARKGLETIKAKVINIDTLPKKIRKVFSHLGNQQEMKEGELTERCWKGYTQKGMKTMFGKRYPNCVKKTK
jgi:hypothetical protein